MTLRSLERGLKNWLSCILVSVNMIRQSVTEEEGVLCGHANASTSCVLFLDDQCLQTLSRFLIAHLGQLLNKLLIVIGQLGELLIFFTPSVSTLCKHYKGKVLNNILHTVLPKQRCLMLVNLKKKKKIFFNTLACP